MLKTYDKQIFIFEADKAKLVDALLETNKFVTVSWTRLNVTNISSYWPIPSNEIYDLIVSLPESVRWDALHIMGEYEKVKEVKLTEYLLLKALRKKFQIPLPENWTPIQFNDQWVFDKKYVDLMRKIVCEYLYITYPNNA